MLAYVATFLCVCICWCCIEESIRDYTPNDSTIREHQATAPVVIAILLCACGFYGVGVWFVILFWVRFMKEFIHDYRRDFRIINEQQHDVRIRPPQPHPLDGALHPLQLNPVDIPLPDDFCVVCQDTDRETSE